ncbi:MAG TPA: hypothetical protein VFD77_06350 [Brumimicrobium sp.]|nr:hypothetical protein [Brumimicrobium sp.]
MDGRISLLILVCFLFFSCKKDEQSCTDGIFTPEKETKMDCGGVCPPCDFQPTVIASYLSTVINGESVSFSNYSLVKSPDWILTFENDSLFFNVNFGSGDSLGGRPITPTYSIAKFNMIDYSTFASGTVVFADVNHTKNELSGYFNAKFISDNDVYDTLVVKSGEFSNIKW